MIDSLISFLTVSVMSQVQVDAIIDGSWDENDPTGTEFLLYLFDLGDFFSSRGIGAFRNGILSSQLPNQLAITSSSIIAAHCVRYCNPTWPS